MANNIERTFPTKLFGKASIMETKYAKGGLAIQLYCIGEAGFKEPLARLSIWLDDSPNLPETCFFVKLYSENHLIAKDCAKSGWFKPRKDLSILHKEPVWELLSTKKDGFHA